MITCQYCGASYQNFQTICVGCGATLPKPNNDKLPVLGQSAPLHGVAKIRQICEAYEDAKEFRPREAIPDKKLRTAEKNFKVFPKGKEIFLFCDTHPLNKGKRGFIICEDGLYWHNTWATKTNRNFLSWEDFAQREVTLKGFKLDLGRGDAISVSGLGSDVKREKALNLLQEVMLVLRAG